MGINTVQRLLASRVARWVLGKQMWERLNDPWVTGGLLLVLQMPKAGSQTIEATLRANGWGVELCRLHFISADWLAWAETALRSQAVGLRRHRNLVMQVELQRRVLRALHLRARLRALGLEIPRLQVITAVREPIGLALSSLFENHQDFFPDLQSVTPVLCRKAVQEHPHFQRFQNWFDVELKPLTGIDIFERPFPREQGFAIYENDRARVLVYRFESLAKIQAILETFLQRRLDQVVDANLSERKPYAEVYTTMKQQVRFPAEFVHDQCQGRMMRHFYSEQERQAFENRWSEPVLEKTT